MKTLSRQAIFRASLLIALIGACLIVVIAQHQTRPSALTWVQTARTATSPAALEPFIQVIANWPRWHAHCVQAERIDLSGQPYPPIEAFIEPQALIRIKMAPPHAEPFSLTLQVTQHHPHAALAMKVLQDTSGRFFKHFQEISWRIGYGQPGVIELKLEAVPTSVHTRLMALFFKSWVLRPWILPEIDRLAQLQNPIPLELLPPSQR